jgi:hypothetical protein
MTHTGGAGKKVGDRADARKKTDNVQEDGEKRSL